MKRVLIIGANRGLGLALVRQCLERGDWVFAGCRHPEKANELGELAAAYPERLAVIRLDVTDEETIDAAKEIVAAQVDALDLLINNAAVNFGDDTIADLTAQTVIDTFRVNTVGPVLVAQRFRDSLKKGRSPQVINISSEAGSISNMNRFRGYSYYGSKAALNMFTRALAWDKGLEGIIVVAMHPGWVRTDMGGNMAPLSPSESAKGILDVVERLTAADAGKFYTHEGKELPW